MVVQITTDFLPVPQVPSAFCPGATGLHLMYCFVPVKRCWLLHLQHPFLNQQANTTALLNTIDSTVECVVMRSIFPPGFRSQARCFL